MGHLFVGFGFLLHTWSSTKQISFSQYSGCKWWSCGRYITPAELRGKINWVRSSFAKSRLKVFAEFSFRLKS